MATGLFNLKQVNQAISRGAWSGYIAPKWVEYLVVAGGGAGGTYGGGGGAGGLLTGIVSVAAGASYTVTIGAGGTSSATPGAGKGVASAFGAISATGGGNGVENGGTQVAGYSGGSGGGGEHDPSVSGWSGGQGIAGQGNAGGVGQPTAGANYSGGGGGGAGTVGLRATSGNVAGNGGAGIASAITGSVVTYAGGGGGSNAGATAGAGGVGGGGAGSNSGVGTAGGGNTGGGGGASIGGGGTGASGGSGIVVVRYPGTVQFFTGGTLSYANGYIIHTFYANGTLAPTTPTPYVTDYQISRSLRFNSADSAYLNRTPASASNQKTWTWSGWVKRSALNSSGESALFIVGTSLAEGTYFNIAFSSDKFVCGSGAAEFRRTTAVYRDVSAWYHLVVAVDTTQATAANRVKMYVNGVEATAFDTNVNPSQNTDLAVNSTVTHNIGRNSFNSSNFFSGYMTEVNFIDGQALTPSSFGYTDPDTGVWSPLKFVGSYGTNGFYLNFSDNSNITSTTLGKDYSGNGNNWTPNNFSVTAGAGNDSLVDSPTSYGTDTGAGGTVRGNYATFNPIGGVSNPSTLTNGNLDVTTPATGVGTTVSTIQIPSSGQYYCEITFVTDAVSAQIGIVDFATVNTNMPLSPNCVTYASSGVKFVDGSSSAYGSSYTTGDIIGLAINADTGSITFYKNNTSQGAITHAVAGLVIGVCDGSNSGGGSVFTGNFGQRPFAYTAPSGFKALCTQNLPTPTIGATTATLASEFFDTTIWAANGDNVNPRFITSNIDLASGGGLIWAKARDLAVSHFLVDSVRGYTNYIATNSTAAESAYNFGIAGTTNGFTFTSSTSSLNQSPYNYVGWQWKAGGTAVTNTAGSVNSQVSANPTSGFSIVTYTGPGGTSGTIGHGLGTTPSMIIVKNRDGITANWTVYHTSLGNTKALYLSTTDAQQTSSAFWNDTSPTSTVFTVGNNAGTNYSITVSYLAYCFAPIAGYSAFGSYTANANADGPFIHTGFRPAFIMLHRYDASGAPWTIIDATRNPYNAADLELDANVTSAEYSAGSGMDILSNGFKLRDSSYFNSGNGNLFLYMAFASTPFKYSLAR